MENKLAKKAFAAVYEPNDGFVWSNQTTYFSSSKDESYEDIVRECRFFYKTDPIVSTVINKLVEIGITPIEIDVSDLSPNETKIFTAKLNEIHKFLRECALEYLITGMVIPEIVFEPISKEEIKSIGIKKYNKIYLPTSMWVRNSEHIKIKTTFFGADKPLYLIRVPQELVSFIKSGGVYLDGTKDEKGFNWLVQFFPTFVEQVKKGNVEIPLDNQLIVRRIFLSDSPYPIPYLYPALESLKHKRNLRLMDYAIAGRVIQAIQHVKVGTDEFPLLEGEEEIFDELRMQLRQGNLLGKHVEKIIQLFTNHTVSIEWVFPDISAILSPTKYDEINDDIFFALGFPRILTTGETMRTQTSNHELATKSPIKTMEKLQEDLLPIVKYIVQRIRDLNNLTSNPKVRFGRVSFYEFNAFMQNLFRLREEGGVSLETVCDYLGLDYSDEKVKLNYENSP